MHMQIKLFDNNKYPNAEKCYRLIIYFILLFYYCFIICYYKDYQINKKRK